MPTYKLLILNSESMNLHSEFLECIFNAKKYLVCIAQVLWFEKNFWRLGGCVDIKMFRKDLSKLQIKRTIRKVDSMSWF